MNTPETELLESAKYRHDVVMSNKKLLEHIAFITLQDFNLNHKDIVLVCIQVVNEHWCDIVEKIMPGEDWQELIDQGVDPFAMSSASWELCETLAARMPEMYGELIQKPIEGMVKLVALSDDGCTIYNIKPCSGTGLQ